MPSFAIFELMPQPMTKAYDFFSCAWFISVNVIYKPTNTSEHVQAESIAEATTAHDCTQVNDATLAPADAQSGQEHTAFLHPNECVPLKRAPIGNGLQVPRKGSSEAGR